MSLRVMWLLNHSSARKFEIPMLKRIGVEKIFLPKSYPADPSFRSACVDFSEDQYLDIPKNELDVLNAADWYSGASAEAWRIANHYFDVVFFILHDANVLVSAAKYFKGAVLWRVYGLDKTLSYARLLRDLNQFKNIESIGRRFYFGEAYPHLADSEPDCLKAQRIYLPLGLANPSLLNNWEGKERLIYFVCPDVVFNYYYRAVYEDFRKSFSGVNYVIAGAQPVYVNDPKVLGYVTNEQHAYNMKQSRVMFYHSQEPNHIHYHPFEAIRAGMPLVFMAGGMLDSMGGSNLPGRCKSLAEARNKIERILADDWGLIKKILASQVVLLEPMRQENCEQAWRDGFARIAADLTAFRAEQAQRPLRVKRKRIAIILPVAYRGGSLRGALALANTLYLGSRQWGEDADVVFFHLDDPQAYQASEFDDLLPEIMRRPFQWKGLTTAEAKRAMRYAGYDGWEPKGDHYMLPDDGMQQAMDCDLWLIVSDRLLYPLLPLRPTSLMVYDYLQRYENLLSHGADHAYLTAARSAARVFVTTEFTRQDALQYAGLDPRKVVKLPMLAPDFALQRTDSIDVDQGAYFLWPTNSAPHKNHAHAAEALRIYYEEFEGELECHVTGVNTQNLLVNELPHLKSMADVFTRCKKLRRQVRWLGEVPDSQYRRLLGGAHFLWHAGRIDNGTFAVIEAACLGVPALSSDYPAMREIDKQFSLNLAWMDAGDPQQMAEQLKAMEKDARLRRSLLPSDEQLIAQRLDAHAYTYWQEVRACL